MSDITLALIDDLKAELSITDGNCNESLIEIKVKNAVREVRNARKYPESYTEDMIAEDLERHYSNIREIALFDYNTIGAEFQTNSSENSVSRTWIDRDKLFDGVYPLAKGVS